MPRWPETFAGWADGQSLTIAMVMAIVSVVIGCGAQTRRPSLFIAIGVGAALVLWFAGQAFGGLMTGQATDPNIGPLFMLLAYAALPAANRSRLMLRTVQTGAWRELGPAG